MNIIQSGVIVAADYNMAISCSAMMNRKRDGPRANLAVLRSGSRRQRAMPITSAPGLREDNRAIVRAASQASKAAAFLLGFLDVADVTAAPSEAVESMASNNEDSARPVLAAPWSC